MKSNHGSQGKSPSLERPIKAFLVLLVVSAAVISSCQAEDSSLITTPSPTQITAIPIQDLMTARPQATATAERELSGANRGDDGTSLERTPEMRPSNTPGPTATPTPMPEPSFHTVEAGDTMVEIAEQYDITIDSFLLANGFNSLSEVTLSVGDQLQIPDCRVHQVVAGNTLSSIAQLCDLTMDALTIANISELATIGTLEGIPLGILLVIPQEDASPLSIDCSTQPRREQVIEYKPEPNEGPFCLSQKFGISESAILQANFDRLTNNTYGTVPLLIPPINGAIYTVTGEDISQNISVDDLAQWYDVGVEAVTDWNGNPVADPLVEGQQLMVTGANLIYGRFQSNPDSE
jgi:LysM repeat protein